MEVNIEIRKPSSNSWIRLTCIRFLHFEALQVPMEEELQGRTMHSKHVPATVSICANILTYTDPIHLRSHGCTQQLVDDFVQELLKIQATREWLMTE